MQQKHLFSSLNVGFILRLNYNTTRSSSFVHKFYRKYKLQKSSFFFKQQSFWEVCLFLERITVNILTQKIEHLNAFDD